MAKTLRNLAGYLFYKDRVEKQLKNQEPRFFSNYDNEAKFQKGLSKGGAKTIEPPVVIGRDKNGQAVSLSKQRFRLGPGLNYAYFNVVRNYSGNNITRSLSLLAAYTKGYIQEGHAQGTTPEQKESFLKIMKSYESSAKSLLNRHDGSFKNLPSLTVMSYAFVAENFTISRSASSNQQGEKSRGKIDRKMVTSEYFAPIINGKEIALPKIEAAARQLREEETKKWIPFEPISTNYDKSTMAGMAEKTNYKRGPTMKKSELINIIKEELENILAERPRSRRGGADDAFGNLDAALSGREKTSANSESAMSEMDRLRALVKKKNPNAKKITNIQTRGKRVTFVADGKAGSFTMTDKENKHVETGAKL